MATPKSAAKSKPVPVKVKAASTVKDVTRYIKAPVANMLWGKAAGRCQFAGCNQPLWKSSVTQEQVNIAQKAHIYSFSGDGPRGNDDITEEGLNDLGNLMLVCHGCHRKIDQHDDGGRYAVPLLRGWKEAHEARVELVTGIQDSKKSHVVLFGANIGDQGSPLHFRETAHILFPDRYPADDAGIELGMINSAWKDCDASFWSIEAGNLERQLEQKVRPRLADGSASHLSVFALAPQPLLMLLGALLTDIPHAEVFQLHREPRSWAWTPTGSDLGLIVRPPAPASKSPPALVLSLSGLIAHDRVHQAMGDAAIWEVTVPTPHNDLLQTREQLQAFRQAMRPLFDRIKTAHGQQTTLNIFPAMPVSAAVELGRIRMPKADMPWRIFDQNNRAGGFVPALDIPQTSTVTPSTR